MATAKEGDLVCFDPLYTVVRGNNGFLKYNDRILLERSDLLADPTRALVKHGCKVMVSNADHSLVLELYKGLKLEGVKHASITAASAEFHRQLSECIFYSWE